MQDKDEYTSAWADGEEGMTSENAVATAKKKSDATEKDAYVTAYTDLDTGKSVNGEDLKNVTPKDKTQVAGSIADDKKD